MAQKELDYGAHEGAELFETTRDYLNGDPRMAARASWFLQFWGYAFEKIASGDAISPPAGVLLFYIDSSNDTLYIKDSTGTLTKFFAGQVLDGNGIDVVDELDGTISIDLNATLDDLNDVTITAEEKFDAIVRNAANTAWINKKAISNVNIDDTDSPYTLVIDALNVHLFCDTTNGAITVNLPPVAGYEDTEIKIIKNDVAANNVTIAADGSETINGAASIDLSQQWDDATIITDGTEWYAKV